MDKWKLEDGVNDYVKDHLKALGINFSNESTMSEYMKQALQGGAKTSKHTGFGKPDFEIEAYDLPVIIEDKLNANKLIKKTKDGEISSNPKDISAYAVNGGLHYAQTMIKSGKYPKGVIFIGVAGSTPDDTQVDIYYAFSDSLAPKHMDSYHTFNFLENSQAFADFYQEAQLTPADKHRILISSKKDLQAKAKKLNELMNDWSISVENRVMYVAGSLLAMQDITYPDGSTVEGLRPDDLKGLPTGRTDGSLIVDQINAYLSSIKLAPDQKDIMLSTFALLNQDKNRNILKDLNKVVAKIINGKASINKQVFTYIYTNVFEPMKNHTGALDIMGEMYSEFLKYATGDGANLGIVLTPPYVTNLMAELLNINEDSRVLDLCTGSAGFLIAAMDRMSNDAILKYGKNTSQAQNVISAIIKDQLMGVELDPKMYTLASTNMVLRNASEVQLIHGNSFDNPAAQITKDFKPTAVLLNPPFSFKENGMPFIKAGLDKLEKGGRAAIIIQDSAGSGRAIETNKQILKNNTLVASIKMPGDLFMPSAGVQTSIYIFEAGVPHDFDKTVRFIDFRSDGYKRSKRGTRVIGHPQKVYEDIVKVAKGGRNAKLKYPEVWSLDKQVFDDQITDSGKDWNFEKHQIIDKNASDKDIFTIDKTQLLNALSKSIVFEDSEDTKDE